MRKLCKSVQTGGGLNIQTACLVRIITHTSHTCMTSAMVAGLSEYGQLIALWSTVTAVRRLCCPIKSTRTRSCDMYLSAVS